MGNPGNSPRSRHGPCARHAVVLIVGSVLAVAAPVLAQTQVPTGAFPTEPEPPTSASATSPSAPPASPAPSPDTRPPAQPSGVAQFGSYPTAPVASTPAAPPHESAEPLPFAERSREPRRPVFGEPRQWVVAGSVFASHLGYSDSMDETLDAGLEPSVDYFIARNVSIGGSLFLRYRSSKATSTFPESTKTASYGAGVRFGWNGRIDDTLSVWPVVALDVIREHWTLSTGDVYAPVENPSQTIVVVDLFAPLLVHPATHFFLGIGPRFYRDLSNETDGRSNDRTFIGVESIVGGWF